MHAGLANLQDYLEAFDQLDDSCNSQEPKQLLNAQQLADLHSQLLKMLLGKIC